MGIRNIFGFWRKKAEGHTLEEITKNYEQLQEELHQERENMQQELEEARKRAEEAEAKLKEEESKRNVHIQYYPGNQLFVIIDGEMIISDDISEERYKLLQQLRAEKDVLGIKKLLLPQAPTEVEVLEKEILQAETFMQEDVEITAVIEVVNKLVQTGDFEVVGDTVQLKGINRSIPKNLLHRFEALIDDQHEDAKAEFEALKNYWRWIVLNPNVTATEEFYRLVAKYNAMVTKEGFILAYRWVKSLSKKPKNKGLVDFVSNRWADIKKRKKGTKNYEVYFDREKKDHFLVGIGIRAGKLGEDRDLNKSRREGNLHDLYANVVHLQDDQTYTDAYTGTMKIKIGQEVSIPRSECDESGTSCSRGLHAAFNIQHHSSNGDTKLLVAICPRDIVSVPYSESKFRCCRYLPLAVLTSGDTDANYLEKGQGLDLLEHYFEIKVNELKEQAEKNTVKEMTVQRLLPERMKKVEEEVAKEEVNQLVGTFSKQITLDNRIKTVS